jgi:hypothetical protein
MPTDGVVTTVAANPTLFIYVPENISREAALYVEDEEGNEVYRATFVPNQSAGVVKLSLPETVSLAVGKNYQWSFALTCDSEEGSEAAIVWGWFRRTQLSPNLKTKLEQEKDPLEQAKLYADHRIWQETLTILASLRDSNPTEWEELLKSVKLEAIAQKPFVECCTIHN